MEKAQLIVSNNKPSTSMAAGTDDIIKVNRLRQTTPNEASTHLSLIDKNTKIWRRYYEKTLNRPHLPRTEFAISLNKSSLDIALDCGCGTGSDIAFLEKQQYQVYGFDVNTDSIKICRNRFGNNPLTHISQASFETFDYPKCGVIIANSSLYFAEPSTFSRTWRKIESCLAIGGVFAGDFLCINDFRASNYHYATSPFTKHEVIAFFSNFEIIQFDERIAEDDNMLGEMEHRHTFSVVAVKRR